MKKIRAKYEKILISTYTWNSVIHPFRNFHFQDCKKSSQKGALWKFRAEANNRARAGAFKNTLFKHIRRTMRGIPDNSSPVY